MVSNKLLLLLFLSLTHRAVLANPRAVEIGPQNVGDLPGGREADGIIGDFVIANDRIEAVVSGNLHHRKANLGTPVTPGCVYDLTLAGANNDQLTWFGPGRQEGQLSSVRILKSGEDGEAIVRAELTSVVGDGIGRIHDYILHDGWPYLLVVSTYTNHSAQRITVDTGADWKGLVETATVANDITVGRCHDPADRIGYAFAGIELGSAQPSGGKFELRIDHSAQFATAIAIGAGTADAFAIISKLKGIKVRRCRGRVIDTSDQPAPTAILRFPDSLMAFVAGNGTFDFEIPKSFNTITVQDLGRPDVDVQLADEDKEIAIAVRPAAAIRMTVRDDAGQSIPCKVQFIGVEGTATPNLGPIIRAHGCDNQYHSENGRFTQALPAGKYRLVITHGIEYDHVEKVVELPAEQTVAVEVVIKRVIDSRGWISADFHNHTTVSGDNYCGTDDRVINLAAEQVEFAPATEHNRIYDWRPHIDRLGLTPFVNTITGIELTGGGPHLNAFPLRPDPYRQDNGAPQWDPDPRINALRLRRHEGDRDNRWVHLNHPDLARYFNDLDGDGKSDSGFEHLESFINAAEVYGEQILLPQWRLTIEYQGRKHGVQNWPFGWLQMINAGRPVWTIATCDAHEVTRGGVGGWRTYIAGSQDDPQKIDYKEVIANAKAGRSFVTTGPFLEVKTSDGHGPGETITTSGSVTLHVRVQCNTWTDIDRVAVLVNGRIDPQLDFKKAEHPELFKSDVVRFEKDLTVELKGDAHVIVVAMGEHLNLATGYGRSKQADWHPVAYHNPIFVDVDGGGFKPNGDMLDQPYLPLIKN